MNHVQSRIYLWKLRQAVQQVIYPQAFDGELEEWTTKDRPAGQYNDKLRVRRYGD